MNTPTKGILILAPMGSGKTYYIKNKIPVSTHHFLDGDELLLSLNIKNRNYFWYDYTKKEERQKIIEAFDEYLNKGYNIFYSGNPKLMKTDIIILPDKIVRWNNLQTREGFQPTKYEFNREQTSFESFINDPNNAIIIQGDIPPYEILNEGIKNLSLNPFKNYYFLY